MKKTALTLAISAISTSVLAQNVVIFGDSLSDIGQKNWNHKASYYKNDKANPLYNELLAEQLGQTLKASSEGGTNYAYSGGVAVGSNSAYTAIQPNVVVQKQIQHYLEKGANPADLHIVWAGGNDIAAILQRALASTAPIDMLLDGAKESATATATQWATLRQAGVETAVFPTVPNVVYTPSLFQLFTQSVTDAIKQQATAFTTPQIAEFIANSFQTALRANAQVLNVSTQHSLADFENSRLDVLRNSVKALYASPLGTALASKIDQETITQALVQQYQQMAQQATQATTLFNQFTTTALNKVGGNIVRLDIDALFKDLLDRPEAYGLTNTVGTACQSTTQAQCTPTNANADQMLFADSFHPNLLAHKVMADYIYTTLNSPKEMAILTRLAEQNSEIALDIARNESNLNRFQRQAEQSVSAISRYQQQKDGHSVHVGLKAQFSPEWQFSAIFSQQNQKGSLGSTKADSKTKAINTALRYDANNWWLGSSLQISSSDFDTQRSVQLGSSIHTQQGNTNGSTISASLFGGYEWKIEQHFVSALADLTYSNSKISAFGEQQKSATQLQFDEQKTNQLKTGIGTEYRYQGQQFQPFISARWVKNWLHKAQTLNVGLNGSRFNVQLPTTDRSWVNMQAGANYQFATLPLQLTAYLSHDLARKQKLTGTTINAGVSYQF
ncbi:esterase [Vespertiliibacter pulmonis]|nr:esterase [Vespertiliibacter pulmonis]